MPRPLGRVQIQVLASLAGATYGAPTISDISRDWPGLEEASVRSAIHSLGRRSLVDVAGFDGAARTWMLTPKGQKAADAIGGNSDDE